MSTNEAQTFEGERFAEPFPSVPLPTLPKFGLSFGFRQWRTRKSPWFPRVDERPQRESKTLPTSGPDVAKSCENDAEGATQGDASQPSVSALWPSGDAVEEALAGALARAAEAGRFDVVAQLAKELEARRLARAGNVVPFTGARRKG